MAQGSMTIKFKVAWWVRPYLQCLSLFCLLTGMEPDFEKVLGTVMRGIAPVVEPVK